MEHVSKTGSFAWFKRHAIVTNAMVTTAVTLLTWFASGQAAVVRLSIATERVDALTAQVADLKTTHQDEVRELTDLRAGERSQRETLATCQQERAVFAAQTQQLPDLKARLAEASEEAASARNEGTLAHTIDGMYTQERDIDKEIIKRTGWAGYKMDGTTDETKDPYIHQLTEQRHDIAEHINTLLAAHPSVGPDFLGPTASMPTSSLVAPNALGPMSSAVAPGASPLDDMPPKIRTTQ
jgi:hypothetical protein